MKSQNSNWTLLRGALQDSWGSCIEISSGIFSDFGADDWSDLQGFLREKTGHFLECRTSVEFEKQFKLSEKVSQSYWDSIDSLEVALKEFVETLDPVTQSQVLMAVVGTLAKLPYGEPSSVSSYSYEMVENVELELKTLVDVLKIGSKENLIGNSFDEHIWAIELLSDFGRSFLVQYMGKTELERKVLKTWGPRNGVMTFDMTAALTLALHSELFVELDAYLMNPRYIHLLFDDSNLTQPWWMDMGLWASAVEVWKDFADIEIDDCDLSACAQAIRDALDVSNHLRSQDFELVSQDEDLFNSLLVFLEESEL